MELNNDLFRAIIAKRIKKKLDGVAERVSIASFGNVNPKVVIEDNIARIYINSPDEIKYAKDNGIDKFMIEIAKDAIKR